LAISIAGLATGGALRLWNAERCAALGEADKGRLVTFVRTKYRLPSNAEIGVADSSTEFGSCFHKLVFASLSGRPFRAELFASPDFRFLTKELLDARPDAMETLRQQRERAAALVQGNLPTRGTGKAPATVAVFSDFQCPSCARMAETLNSLAASEGDRVRVVYHFFPLSMHRWARPAAEAGACAQRQSNAAFWSLRDFLFAHQHELSVDNLSQRVSDWAGTTPNLDRGKFEACVNEGLTSGQVEQDMALGEEVGVHATPTLFLNGEPIDGATPDELRASIRRIVASGVRAGS
jgi:protein-disulfide isomerase